MENHVKSLLLGSASLRRKQILAEIGVPFTVEVPSVDEVLTHGNPRESAEQNARLKHEWCLSRFPDRPIITADTVVAFENKCIGKPENMDEARRFLRMFSGKSQLVYTAVVLYCPGHASETHVVQSSVAFRNLTEKDIESYLSAVDPMDKAGAYDINVRSDLIIAGYEGSYTNIMGLPAEVVTDWLRRVELLP